MARPFRFRLQALLRVRELHEQEAKRKLGAKIAEIARCEALNEQTRTEIGAAQRELLEMQGQREITAEQLTRQKAWIAHLWRTIAERDALRRDLEGQRVALERAWLEARRQRRVIEKLRERKSDLHNVAEKRRDQDDADELAQQMPRTAALALDFGGSAAPNRT